MHEILQKTETVRPDSGIGLVVKTWVLRGGPRVNVGHGEYTAAQARQLARGILECADAAEAHDKGTTAAKSPVTELMNHMEVSMWAEGVDPEAASRVLNRLLFGTSERPKTEVST
jgi:hypothetical protein